MIQDSTLRQLALQAGISQKEIVQIYFNAINEAETLGKENDDNFILDIIKTFIGLNEESIKDTIANLNKKFLESGYTDFNQFLEDTWTSTAPIGGVGTVVSTDFPPSVRPEHMLGHSVKVGGNKDDEEAEEKDKKEESK